MHNSNQENKIAKYYHMKPYLFSLLLGFIMPMVMTLTQSGTLVFPRLLWQLLVYETIGFLFGIIILDVHRISTRFVEITHTGNPPWLRTVSSQVPTGIIFSLLMGFAAIIMNVGLSGQAMIFFLFGLPKSILIAVVVQLVIEIALEKGLKPAMTR